MGKYNDCKSFSKKRGVLCLGHPDPSWQNTPDPKFIFKILENKYVQNGGKDTYFL